MSREGVRHRNRAGMLRFQLDLGHRIKFGYPLSGLMSRRGCSRPESKLPNYIRKTNGKGRHCLKKKKKKKDHGWGIGKGRQLRFQLDSVANTPPPDTSSSKEGPS
eukprot:gene22821-biopygen1970